MQLFSRHYLMSVNLKRKGEILRLLHKDLVVYVGLLKVAVNVHLAVFLGGYSHDLFKGI